MSCEKSYNGFSGKQRCKVQYRIKKAIEKGELYPLNQIKCCICGQDKGIREYHCEDYSLEKYIDNAIPLCYQCHRTLHRTIDDKPNEWEEYLENVRNGILKDPVYISTYWTEDNDQEIIYSVKGCIKRILKEHEKFKKHRESENEL